MEYSRKLLDKLSVEQLKIELLHTAYGNGDTFIAKLDPRTLFIWYLFFGFAPWFIYDESILFSLFLLMLAMTINSKVSPLILFILGIGLMSQAGYLFVVSWFFGGNLETIVPLMTLTLKLAIISLASIVVFNSMDPEKLSDGFLSIGMPGHVSFAISYGYRMLPNLMEEYHQIFLSFRLRGKAPETRGFLYIRSIIYFMRITVRSFYPLILSSAKRARTTVEALETKGYSEALSSQKVKKIKLKHLHFGWRDYCFLSFSILYTLVVFIIFKGVIK